MRDHRVLPILLQRMEAQLILKEVVPTIVRVYPDQCLYTIHDAVVGPLDMIEGYAEQLREGCDRYLGYRPTMKVERWVYASEDSTGVVGGVHGPSVPLPL
jgi:hypothetical protein